MKLYPDVFTSLGRLEPSYLMQLEENYTPLFHVPELYRTEASGVIEKVGEPTEWVNPDGSL